MHQSTWNVYKLCLKALLTRENTKNNTFFEQEPNHSTKSNKDIESISMHIFTQVNKLLRKEFFKK